MTLDEQYSRLMDQPDINIPPNLRVYKPKKEVKKLGERRPSKQSCDITNQTFETEKSTYGRYKKFPNKCKKVQNMATGLTIGDQRGSDPIHEAFLKKHALRQLNVNQV